MASQRLTQPLIIAALKAAAGKVSLAAKKLSCSPSYLYRRVKASAKLREVLDEERESVLDMAEVALKRAIVNGEAWAVCFALKTIGKERGYVERQQLEHGGRVEGGIVEVRVDANFFGNADRLAALAHGAPAGALDAPGPEQSPGMRPALGQDGAGVARDDAGTRPGS